MRIVQVSVGSVRMPPAEGSAPLQVIFNVSRQLAGMGHDVTILDRKYSSNDLSNEQVDGVEIARLNAWQVPSGRVPRIIRFILAEFNAVLFALAVSSYLRKNSSKIDVIHLHLTSIGLIVSILNRKLRSKMFYTCHLGHWVLADRKLPLFEKIHVFLDPFLMRRVNKVIALNEQAKESFRTVGRIEADHITVIPNGVDTDFFKPSVDIEEVVRRYELSERLTVLFVGRLAQIKGIAHLIRAANVVVNELGYGNALFMLAGPSTFDATEGPISVEEIWNMTDQFQIGNNVLLTGPLSLQDVRALYSACDIFVLPSLVEGDPLVIPEAMASGKPIVATKVGGIPQKVRDNWNGFLVDPGDEQQLADRIGYLLGSIDERKRMGENSRRYAEEEFDWGIITERLLQVYEGT